jgi:Family of unknown function (DUF6062)
MNDLTNPRTHHPLVIFLEPGCPACRAAGVAEQRSMRWFLRDNYSEVPTLTALLERRVCTRHAASMFAGQNAHLTLTFEFLAKARLGASSGKRSPGLARRHQSRTRTEGRPCLICEAGEGAANVAVLDVVEALRSEPGRAAYLQHEGLCLPHHDAATKQAEGELRAWLEQQLRRRLESFIELFQLYDKHRDVRFRHEPRGAEQEAWRRALRFFWGDVAVRLAADPFDSRQSASR